MNWNILGHEWAVELLRDHITHQNVRHAYLFAGPPGVGRRSLAIRLAQALNCPQPQAPGEPCLICSTCSRIERMQHPDLFIVQSEQRGGSLKVDQVRELQHSLSLAPYEARYRVALFLNFETANLNASNALLKTLEEPNPHVVLILTAVTPEQLIPTIVSRCEVLRLRPLPLDLVQNGLQTIWGVEPERARLLAHISGGRPGYAVQLDQNPHQMEQRQAWLDDHYRLLTANLVERFLYADTLTNDKDKDKAKENFKDLLPVWISLWRDVLLRAAGTTIPTANLDRSSEITALAEQFNLDTAHQTIAVMERIQDLLTSNINLRLAAEVLMLSLPKVASASTGGQMA